MVFLPQKAADFKVFFRNFHKSGPFLRGILPQKWLLLQSFGNFVKWDALVRIFFTKMEPMSRIFGEKVTHLGSTSLYALTCEYPPLDIFHVKELAVFFFSFQDNANVHRYIV